MPGLLIAKLGPYAGSLVAFIAAIKVDLSALWIVAGALAIIVAQLIAIPKRMRSFWYQEAQRREEENKILQKQLREKAEELAAAQQTHTEQMAAFAREQQEVRHSLKNELAIKDGQLELERGKRDLTVVLNKLDESALVHVSIAEQLQVQTRVLEQILAALPAAA